LCIISANKPPLSPWIAGKFGKKVKVDVDVNVNNPEYRSLSFEVE